MMRKQKKTGHGGKRIGSGRKRIHEPTVTYNMKITGEQAELLKKWGGGDLSAGLRWLIDTAKVFVNPT